MKRAPVLFVIDEMAQLGPYMKILENCMGMAAGATRGGIKLLCVLQDISQLRGMFPKTYETFIQNCGVTMWFGARDQSTREYISKLGGLTEVLSQSISAHKDERTGEVVSNRSASQGSRQLILPHEAGHLAKDEMIMFVEGVNGPILAKRKSYWTISKFRGKFRRNPYINDNRGGLLKRLFG